MTVELATKRLIGAVWTVAFTRVDGGVKILAYDRNIDEGYQREDELPRCNLVEDANRTVVELVIGKIGRFGEYIAREGERLKVVNPRNVFDYGSDY